ncbi:Kinase [Aphelenchoides besseyi]|nr:Kinase [Aphelenchoides besseyi]
MDVVGFPHQVGGHFGLLRCENHVLKPLNQREFAFYSQLNGRLSPFSAKFCGRIRVGLESTKDGVVLMTTESRLDCHSNQQLNKSESEEEEEKPLVENSLFSLTFRLQNRRVQVEQATQANLWAVQCQTKVVQKLVDAIEQTHRGQQSFILLEDVVSNFNCPCVIDLKLGIRQHGDDADEQKKLTQILKCSESTSLKYGIRLVGMQMFDRSVGDFIYVNKYEGRRMSKIQLGKTLALFFVAAGYERTKRLLDQLYKLKQLIESLPGFRFFSSSLLIAYDGRPSSNSSDVVIKMIDFANATFSRFLSDKQYEGVDDGYLLGVNSLIGIVNGILEEMTEIGCLDEESELSLSKQTRKRKLDWTTEAPVFVSVDESTK